MWNNVCIWLAYHLPNRVVYYAAIRVAVAATCGKYSHQVVPELTCTEALQRWELK